MSKQKREKKKKNEIKNRTLQKLQLGMTAPTDLDMEDRALGGEDEMFDLGEGEREMSRADVGGHNLHDAVRDADGMSDSEDEASAELPVEDVDLDGLSSDEEREYRTRQLEGTLDDLYDDYKERMAERDTKWKVKQARLKDRNYDSWHGIREEESDDGVDKGYRDQMVRRFPRRGDAPSDDDEGEESGEGGWDVVAAHKAKLGDEPDSSDESADEDAAPKPKKKAPVRIRGVDTRAPEPRKLVTSLTNDARANMSRQAQVWFDQGVFKGVGDLAALDGEDDDEDEDEDHEEDDGSAGDDESGSDNEMDVEDGDIEMGDSSTLEADDDDDDFEIVPQAVDEDPEWDVDNEDQDEVLQKKIQGRCRRRDEPGQPLTRHRQGYSHRRGTDAGEPAGEP